MAETFNKEVISNHRKGSIISQLKRDILPLQGLKVLATDNKINFGFHPIEAAFPNKIFPIGCVHEFLSEAQQDNAATQGFLSALLSKLMQFNGTVIWISSVRKIFPFALTVFGIKPEQIIFIDVKNEKEILYATEESLKCNRVTAVISEVKNISFKESRRFQLAAEQSRVTGFLIRHQVRSLNTIACMSRWRITSLPSELGNGMPGVGFPRWYVELLKVRNGKTGSWKIECCNNALREIQENKIEVLQTEIKKVG